MEFFYSVKLLLPCLYSIEIVNLFIWILKNMVFVSKESIIFYPYTTVLNVCRVVPYVSKGGGGGLIREIEVSHVPLVKTLTLRADVLVGT